SGSSSSSVGRRLPDSSRESVLAETPVCADSSPRVTPRSRRSARSRGPAAVMASFRSSSTASCCQIGNGNCHPATPGCMVVVEVVPMVMSTVDEWTDDAEVVVIGGGAAGLSGALMLARARRSVVVVDAGAPRNAPADGVHGLLARDGTPPGELLDRGRAEVRSYGGEIVRGEVETVERDGDRFAVR